MSFEIQGEMIETCSCNMLCPCWYGVPALMVMDQGWCGTPMLVRIENGTSDGVDLSGIDLVVGLFFPGPTLFDGSGTGRLYVDDRTSDTQVEQLEKIFLAREGGPMEVPASLIDTWLTTKRTRIEVSDQDGEIDATVDGIGEIVSKRLVNDLGDRVTMQNAAFSLVWEFEDRTGELAPSDGTSWRDPDLPETWESKSGVVGRFRWHVG